MLTKNFSGRLLNAYKDPVILNELYRGLQESKRENKADIDRATTVMY